MSDTGPTDNARTDNGGEKTPHDDRLTSRSQWSNWTVLAMIVLCFFALCFFAIYYLVPKFKGDASIPQFKDDAAVEGLAQLELQPLVGDQASVALGDLTGRVVLLNFWGTWCPPCRVEFPHLAALREKFLDQPAFQLLSVSCGSGGPEDLGELRHDTELFLQQMGTEMPIYADPDLVSRKAVDQLIGFEGYPTTLIIGRRGTVRGTWVGFNPGDEAKMEALVEELLAEG